MALRDSLAHVSARGLGFLLRTPFAGPFSTWAFLLAAVAAIGVVDYASGVNISLAIFYLFPISFAAGWLGARAGLMITVLSTIVRFGGDAVYPGSLPPYFLWRVIATGLIYSFVVWLVDSLVSAHHRLEGRVAVRTSELAASIADRRRLEVEIVEITARERAAIGRELHDELGQHLVATALAAQVLARQLGEEKGGKEAHAIVGWIEDAIAKTRKLARGLLIARIESDRLAGELEDLAATANQGGVRCTFNQSGDKLDVSASQGAQLFRIAQEAIGNALRHGRASEIEITLAIDADATCLIVTDDGIGFRTGENAAGLGLQIMQYRAQLIGASVAVLSTPGQGTRVVCRLPTKAAVS
jgi:signal transduction histidine kinase